jgi:H+/Cl- antiporter ClcA
MTNELLFEAQAGVFKFENLLIFNVGANVFTYRPLELLPFVAIGIGGGLLGAAFTSLNFAVARLRTTKINKQRRWRVWEVAAITLCCSSVQFLLPFAFGCK